MPLSLTTMAVTQGEVDAYASARGVADWTAATTGKTEAMRRGQDYIAGRYNAKWSVSFDNAAAPTEVKYAIAEAAIRELRVPFSLTPDLTLGTANVLTGIDTIKWTPVKSDAKVDDLRPTLTAIDGLLFGFVVRYLGPWVA
jgi:hypothetical protein